MGGKSFIKSTNLNGLLNLLICMDYKIRLDEKEKPYKKKRRDEEDKR
jgi:hypothetical protein